MLSDQLLRAGYAEDRGVLMHLMVLRAFWRTCTQRDPLPTVSCLNAPYGAQCFLTRVTWSSRRSPTSLNASYGALCFLTRGCWHHDECAQQS